MPEGVDMLCAAHFLSRGAAAAVRSLHSILVLAVATALLHMLLTRAYCACSAAVENLRISGSMSLFSKDAAKGAK